MPTSSEHNLTGAAVSFQDVTVERGGVPIVTSVSATVPPGRFTAIIGANGAGKTTLLLALLGKIGHGGAVRVLSPVPDRPPRIGYVPQRFEFDRGMPLTVSEVLLMGRQRRPLFFGRSKRFESENAELLEAVGVAHLADRQLGALSVGEQQRVLLALSLQRQPDLLLLDEPAAGVDYRGEQLLCGLLDALREKLGFTQLMVSHDLGIVTAHADHVICLNRRLIGEGPPQEILTPQVLEATFGVHRGMPTLEGLPKGTQLDLDTRCKECIRG
ncbi:MAG: metal ABC transporter ATP-binding protein [Syntrophobacteraceae bacterium]